MTTQAIDYVEKRDYIRMPINATAKVHRRNIPDVVCLCRNLSAAGMLLEIDRELPIHSRLTVTLPSQTEGFSSLVASVIVTRCVDYHGDRYLIGARIDEIMN
ncbi:PilZ domain-containing protein [Gynuella sunshinyii]|uniref:PilZ domain-containing protein n=1 Tax=Gynuella sunshinyii YC6258 TaxID=1445510 RepID=A0A0C5V6X1_9GAMM|nr:PilZ domain-containing protein [Gynuella sunshinyii]AJQ95170.1 hypothetical Protein YC6258_03134 [Gynuella sunshinyii YC6258]